MRCGGVFVGRSVERKLLMNSCVQQVAALKLVAKATIITCRETSQAMAEIVKKLKIQTGIVKR
jgi:hypothetical protein